MVFIPLDSGEKRMQEWPLVIRKNIPLISMHVQDQNYSAAAPLQFTGPNSLTVVAETMSFLSLEVSLLNEIQQRCSKKACFLLRFFPQNRLTSKCRQSWAHPAKELSMSLLKAFKSSSGILLWRFIPFLVSNLIIAFLLNCLWAVWPLKSGSVLARLGVVIPH